MSAVLLIEPDRLSAKLYQSALENVGHKVRTVYGAQSALNALDAGLPDIICLELDMPGHNGLEFLYEFCTYNDWSGLPVVVHSSVPEERFQSMLVNWRELSVRDYLYKAKSTLADLQRTIARHSMAKA